MTMTERELRVGIIGYGAIGSCVAEAICSEQAGKTVLAAVLCRDASKHSDAIAADPQVTFTDDPQRFLGASIHLVVEAAGKDALRQYGNRILEAGSDLLITSIGAFTDDEFFQQLLRCAEEHGARLLLFDYAVFVLKFLIAELDLLD